MTGEEPSRARSKRATAQARREKLRHHRLARILGVFIAVAAAFVLGFILRSQTGLMQNLGVPLSATEASLLTSQTSVQSSINSLANRVSSVEAILDEFSLDNVPLDDGSSAMLSAMMASTGDPYATYFDPERYGRYISESAERGDGGIGVLFDDDNGQVFAADVFSGSEAEAEGVAQGDRVESIDGVDASTWTVTEVIGAVAAKNGEDVVITWLRPAVPGAATGSTFTTTLLSRPYEEQNLDTELVDSVGYIRLRQITQNAAKLVNDAVRDLDTQGARAYVLDIRDNPGGYLTQAVDIASLFLDSGIIVQIETKDDTTSKTATGVTITGAPLVILVNGYTASASEVLAAALQDNQRAQVVGERTQGKGSVQMMRELSFGGAVRFTAAYYLTPSGRSINDGGIVPNITVSSGGEDDTQRLVAIDTAASLAGPA